GEDVSLASGGAINLALNAQARWHAGQAIGLVAAAASADHAATGLSLIAAQDAIDVQAQGDSLKVQAKEQLTLQSANAAVEIAAARKVRIATAQGAAITIEGGNITFEAPGTMTYHAGMRSFSGPTSLPVNLQGFPVSSFSLYNETFKLLSPTGVPLSSIDYAVTAAEDQGHESQTLQRTGLTPRVDTPAPQKVKFSLVWPEIEVDTPPSLPSTEQKPSST
ncbi:MAG: DUF2345 domain-containing protein, partial [Pseudomonas sp.]